MSKKIIITLMVAASAIQAGAQNKYAVKNVTVIPMTTDTTLSQQTVLISNGIIEDTGPSAKVKIPSGYTIIDGNNKYMLPGLMDMHLHFFQEQYEGHKSTTTEAELKLMLANGITTARIMAGHPDYLQARENVKTGKWFGPALVVASPQLVGAWPWPPEFKNYEIIKTKTDAVNAVKKFKQLGYDAIKITFMVNRECYDAIVSTAKSENIKVVGHVGPKVKLPAALAAGEQIEHMDEFIDMLLPDTTYNHGESVSDMNIWRKAAWATVPYLDENKIPALVKAVKDAGIFVTPTNYFFLSSFGTIPAEAAIKAKPDYNFIPKALAEERWNNRDHYIKMGNPAGSMEKYVRIRKKMVYELWKAGVPLMAGSDSPEFFLVPGFSLHDELAAFAEAGLPPFAALQTATVNTASFLEMNNKGTIEKGKVADLLLLDKNPLADIGNTRSIVAVFKTGVYCNRKQLDNMLQEFRGAAGLAKEEN